MNSHQQRTVQVAESKSISDKDILRMLHSRGIKAKIIMYDDLRNYSWDKLLNSVPAVVLLNIKGKNAPEVGHWIALLPTSNGIEHFDPYGFSPDEELSITHEQPYLKRLYGGMPVTINKERLQRLRDHVNTCGRHCVSRLLLGHKTLYQYIAWLRGMHETPDVAVTLLTMHL